MRRFGTIDLFLYQAVVMVKYHKKIRIFHHMKMQTHCDNECLLHYSKELHEYYR